MVLTYHVYIVQEHLLLSASAQISKKGLFGFRFLEFTALNLSETSCFFLVSTRALGIKTIIAKIMRNGQKVPNAD